MNVAAVLGIAGCLSASGCTHEKPPTNQIAPGIVFQHDVSNGVELLDVDLLAAKVIPTVVAEHVSNVRGNHVGDARTVSDWAARYGAVGGMNAGYFGEAFDQTGARKQIVGLAIVGGTVVAPGHLASSTKQQGTHMARSAIGFARDGAPDVEWATADSPNRVQIYKSPSAVSKPRFWTVQSAVACGPTLFRDGTRHIYDHEEWLVSHGKLPRAFVAFDRENGRPRHLVIGRADAMEFTDVAAFLADYFAKTHQSSPREAMCLDGGPSAQLVYRANGALVDVEPTGVLVPTAILLVPDASAAPYFPPAKAGGN